MSGPDRIPLEERFWARVQKTETCWLWTGATSQGYGVISVGGYKGKNLMAHRVAYELTKGPIPEGLVIDHLCRAPRCVNPDHLEAVTTGDNVRRGLLGEMKTHCSHGHAYADEGRIDFKGHRVCRACRRADAKRASLKKKINAVLSPPVGTPTKFCPKCGYEGTCR